MFVDELEYISKLVEKTDIKCIIGRVTRFIEIQEKLKYNVNLNLLLDKLVLEFE